MIPIFKEFTRILKPTGRLIFSYANREAAAWVNLFAALKAAKLCPHGFTIVHSENETEPSKRNRGACHLDLILELGLSPIDSKDQFRPKPVFDSAEENYLLAVGDAFLKSFSMVNGWEKHLVGQLSSEVFVHQDVARGTTIVSKSQIDETAVTNMQPSTSTETGSYHGARPKAGPSASMGLDVSAAMSETLTFPPD